MFAKQFAIGLAAAALLSTTALAQAPAKEPAQSSSMPRAETPAKPVQEQSANEWRASKVIGLYVYNDANDRLGSISEVLMDASGKINKAVIGVGGFLGIGESNIAVNFDQLKFVTEPMRTTTTTAPAPASGSSADRPSTVGTTATTTTATASKPSINPDHAKLSMTKEQLQALPNFKFAN